MVKMKKIWDNTIVRLNWLFALCLGGIIITAGVNGVLAYAHTLFASLLFIAVTLRIFYGFAGTQTARFSTMLYPTSDIILHMQDMIDFRPQSWVGHSPIGGLFAFLALLGLGLTALTGLFAINGEGYASWVSSWADEGSLLHSYALHAVITTFTLVLWSIYAIGVVVNLFSNRDSLATYIWGGRKSVILRHNLNDAALTAQPRGMAWSSFALSSILALALLFPFVYQVTTPTVATVEYAKLDADGLNEDAQELSQIETAAGLPTGMARPEATLGHTNVRSMTNPLPVQNTQNTPANTSGFDGISIDIPVQKQ